MKIIIKNSGKAIEVKNEKTLLEVLHNNNIKIKSNCEGNCACGQCLVAFEKNVYNTMDISNEELDLVDKQLKKKPYTRLACQVQTSELIDNCVVEIL